MTTAREVTTKAQLLAATHESYGALQREIADLTDEQMIEPGVLDGWSVKDVLAHISDWERLFTGWMHDALDGGRPDRPETIDEAWVDTTNARLHEESADRSLEAVRAEAQRTHNALLALIERLSDDDLFDPQRFAFTHGRNIAPWVRGNADEHYDEHRAHIAAWKQRHRA